MESVWWQGSHRSPQGNVILPSMPNAPCHRNPTPLHTAIPPCHQENGTFCQTWGVPSHTCSGPLCCKASECSQGPWQGAQWPAFVPFTRGHSAAAFFFPQQKAPPSPYQSVGCWESPWSCPIEHLTTAHFVAAGKSVCSGLEQQQQCCTTRTCTTPSDGILNARHHQQTHHESPSRHRYKKRREKDCEQETFMHLFQTHKKYVLA